MMRVNYEDFLSRYESSGMTQQEFGDIEGMSASMVSYYVRKGRDLREGDQDRFVPIQIAAATTASSLIKISYPSGVVIEIPV